MAHVKFVHNFDYVHPSRAMTAYKAGWSGTVKAEIAEAAKAAGALDNDLPTTRAELEKLATDEGVDLAAIVGTGGRGQVVNDDISAAIIAKRAGETLPGNLPADLAEPSALNPALHDGSNSA